MFLLENINQIFVFVQHTNLLF